VRLAGWPFCLCRLRRRAVWSLSVFALACQGELVAPPRPQPVPPSPPVNLLAEAELAMPAQFWSAGRREVGKPARPFPEHLALVLTQLLGISPALSGRIEADQPAYAACATTDAGLDWVFAFKVNSGREWVAELATGGSARFRKRESGRVTHLDGSLPFGVMGVVRNYVVVGSSATALETLGPYAVRSRAQPGGSRGVRVVSPATGATLEALFQRWIAPLQGALVAVAGEHALGAKGEQSLASIETGLGQIAIALSDALGVAEGLQLEFNVEEGALVLHGRFRALAGDVEDSSGDGPDMCAALRRLPEEAVAVTAFASGLPAGSLDMWLHAFGLSGDHAAAQTTQELPGPVLFGWIQEAERAGLMVSFAARDPEHVQRQVTAWFGSPPAQVELVKGVTRWKNVERMQGTEHSLEVAWAFSGGRGYVTFGAGLASFWANLLGPSNAPRSARLGLDGGCSASHRARLWGQGLGYFAVATTDTGAGELTGKFPLAQVARFLVAEPAR
jgi:hypothetical protein